MQIAGWEKKVTIRDFKNKLWEEVYWWPKTHPKINCDWSKSPPVQDQETSPINNIEDNLLKSIIQMINWYRYLDLAWHTWRWLKYSLVHAVSNVHCATKVSSFKKEKTFFFLSQIEWKGNNIYKKTVIEMPKKELNTNIKVWNSSKARDELKKKNSLLSIEVKYTASIHKHGNDEQHWEREESKKSEN